MVGVQACRGWSRAHNLKAGTELPFELHTGGSQALAGRNQGLGSIVTELAGLGSLGCRGGRRDVVASDREGPYKREVRGNYYLL